MKMEAQHTQNICALARRRGEERVESTFSWRHDWGQNHPWKGGQGKARQGCLREGNDKGDDCLMYDATCIHGPLKGSKRGLETMGSMMSRESPSKNVWVEAPFSSWSCPFSNYFRTRQPFTTRGKRGGLYDTYPNDKAPHRGMLFWIPFCGVVNTTSTQHNTNNEWYVVTQVLSFPLLFLFL